MSLQATTTSHQAVSFRPRSRGVLRVVGDRVTPVVDAAMGAGRFEIFDVTGPEGSGPPPHSHSWDESYFVLRGRLAVVDWSAGLESPREEVLDEGGSAFIPGNTTHSFQVRTEACRFLIVTTPGAHGFFADVEATLQGVTDDLDTLIEVAKRNGLSSPLF